jgi:hypothetical protein
MSPENDGGNNLPVPIQGGRVPSIDVGGFQIPLKRTLAALDKLIATPIEVLADAVEKKLKDNLDSHVEAVKRKREQRGKKEKIAKPSVKTTKAIGEWATAAAEVDMEDRDLSAVWRAVLDEILDERRDGEDLLRIVKSTPSSEIRFFLKRFGPRKEEMRISDLAGPYKSLYSSRIFWELDPIKRLRDQGLLRPLISASMFAVGAAIVTIYLYFTKTVMDAFFQNPFDWRLAVPLLIASMLVYFVPLRLLYRPTELGERLRDLYEQYRQDYPDQ